MTRKYLPLTALEVAGALAFSDCEELTSEQIAQGMLDGEERFSEKELEKLADFCGMTVGELIDADERFEAYRDEAETERLVIAMRALQAGLGLEMSADICGLTINKVIKLRKQNK